MKTEIIKALKQETGYLSGQELCEKLGVSRTAVWKVIRQLQEEGYEIEAVRNRGYRLSESGDIFTEAELKSAIQTQKTGRNLVLLETVDSTNNKAKQLAEEGAADGTLVVADSQSGGKGRRGKLWSSPSGAGVWMSLILRPQCPPASASMLTLVAALSVNRGIREVTSVSSQIKWPNDIVINGKKVCGILTEMSAEPDLINHVVVGIGINSNNVLFPKELEQVATSLRLASGQLVKRAKLVNAVLCAWEEYYHIFLQTENLSGLVAEYNDKLTGLGGAVKVLMPADSYDGISQGVDENGRLLVKKSDGTVMQVVSGEVSVRGIYGYV